MTETAKLKACPLCSEEGKVNRLECAQCTDPNCEMAYTMSPEAWNALPRGEAELLAALAAFTALFDSDPDVEALEGGPLPVEYVTIYPGAWVLENARALILKHREEQP